MQRKAKFLDGLRMGATRARDKVPILMTLEARTGGLVLGGAPPIPSRSVVKRGVIKAFRPRARPHVPSKAASVAAHEMV